ncbi:MAG: hypothetical protein ABI583_09450 [Betaproteobacteria bacterium]
MNTRISKDTFLMGALLAVALLTVGFASIRTNEDLLARDASLMVVKSATLIADARPVNQVTVL